MFCIIYITINIYNELRAQAFDKAFHVTGGDPIIYKANL